MTMTIKQFRQYKLARHSNVISWRQHWLSSMICRNQWISSILCLYIIKPMELNTQIISPDAEKQKQLRRASACTWTNLYKRSEGWFILLTIAILASRYVCRTFAHWGLSLWYTSSVHLRWCACRKMSKPILVHIQVCSFCARLWSCSPSLASSHTIWRPN